MNTVRIPANYYQQFDANYDLDVPAEGYGGWQRAEVDLSLDHTALVVMHAWDVGTFDQYPGWWRAVEAMQRMKDVCRDIFPPLLDTVRSSPMPVLHVASGQAYAERYPSYGRTLELAGPDPAPPEQIESDPALDRLRAFRAEHVSIGPRNRPDVTRGFENVDFAPEAKPLDHEGIAKDDHQLFALCKDMGVNHLVYIGFAINWCLLMSPGGMLDMRRRGFMCSAIRQAVSAVENKETARHELCKEIALWRVALAFGFVFDVDDFMTALKIVAKE